jgi:hypothetical protein
MGWIYLAESADSVWPCHRGLGQSPTVRTTDTLKAFYCLGCGAENYRPPEFGTTSPRSYVACCPHKKLKSSTADFPVRISALRDLERAWKASEADFSLRSSGSLKKFAQLSSSLKTSQQSGHADLHAFSLSSPLYGMTVDGRLSLPLKLEPRTLGKDGSCWQTPVVDDACNRATGKWNSRGEPKLSAQVLLPTPTASSCGTNRGGGSGRIGKVRPSLNTMASRNLWPTPRASANENRQTKLTPSQIAGKHGKSLAAEVGGLLSPTWVEWLMGYPSGWTVLEDWATQWFRPKRAPRSKG